MCIINLRDFIHTKKCNHSTKVGAEPVSIGLEISGKEGNGVLSFVALNKGIHFYCVSEYSKSYS